jgi:hypothetical protein
MNTRDVNRGNPLPVSPTKKHSRVGNRKCLATLAPHPTSNQGGALARGGSTRPPRPFGGLSRLPGFCDQQPNHEQEAGAEHGRYGCDAPKHDQDYESDRCGHHKGFDSVLAVLAVLAHWCLPVCRTSGLHVHAAGTLRGPLPRAQLHPRGASSRSTSQPCCHAAQRRLCGSGGYAGGPRPWRLTTMAALSTITRMVLEQLDVAVVCDVPRCETLAGTARALSLARATFRVVGMCCDLRRYARDGAPAGGCERRGMRCVHALERACVLVERQCDRSPVELGARPAGAGGAAYA